MVEVPSQQQEPEELEGPTPSLSVTGGEQAQIPLMKAPTWLAWTAPEFPSYRLPDAEINLATSSMYIEGSSPLDERRDPEASTSLRSALCVFGDLLPVSSDSACNANCYAL